MSRTRYPQRWNGPGARDRHRNRPPVVHPLAALAAADPELAGAACKGRGPDWDAEVVGESEADRHARHARAVRVCRSCPVQPACRAVAAASPPEHVRGVWAGVVHLARPPGRPPAHPPGTPAGSTHPGPRTEGAGTGEHDHGTAEASTA